MKKYTNAELLVVRMSNNDIVTASGFIDDESSTLSQGAADRFRDFDEY